MSFSRTEVVHILFVRMDLNFLYNIPVDHLADTGVSSLILLQC